MFMKKLDKQSFITLTKKGNTIQADAVDTKDGKPNTDYNTADNDMKPTRITTPEGKVYELIPSIN